MKMYERSILVDIIESRLLESYSEYYPQQQYNNMFVSYLYRYLRDNTYSGEHYNLLKQLLQLKEFSDTLTIKENTDRRTYTITDSKIISNDILKELSLILKQYNNYKYIVKSPNRIVFEVSFGWLPPNAGSWLNLLNSETLIDYYIDGITLRPNTHTTYGGRPDSGYVCYKINGIHEYDTIMFLINKDLIFEPEDNVKFTFASLLEELEGSKGATLNRIVTTDSPPLNCFYELGPYSQNYLSTDDASLIIQVPYEYAISEAYYVFDVGNSVYINPKNNINNENDIINWYIPFTYKGTVETFEDINNIEDYTPVKWDVWYVKDTKIYYVYVDNKWENFMDFFIKFNVNINTIDKIINSGIDILDTTLTQYILGDFIWRTADSKLIAYAQNLINSLIPTAILTPDGIWSDKLSDLVRQYKEAYGIYSLFDDDVIDKTTEEIMITMYKREFNKDANYLFNEW